MFGQTGLSMKLAWLAEACAFLRHGTSGIKIKATKYLGSLHRIKNYSVSIRISLAGLLASIARLCLT